MRAFARACWRNRASNSCGPDGHCAATHACRDALVDEQVEVAPDRHLADVELGGEIGDADAPVGVEATAHELEPFQRVDVHSVPPPRRAVGERRVSHVRRRASRTPRGRALHERVAERGGLDRTDADRPPRPRAERVEQQRRSGAAAEDPHARPASTPGSDAITCAADRAIDSTAQRVIAARSRRIGEPGEIGEGRGHVGRGEEPRVECVADGHRRDRRGAREEVVEVGVAPLAPALLDQPPPGDVAQEADAAERAVLVAEPGRERRGRRVGLVLLAPDEQPRAGGDERGVGLARRRGRPTRCRGRRRGAPGSRASSRPAYPPAAGWRAPRDRSPIASARSADHVPVARSSSPVVPADEGSRGHHSA